MLPHNFYEMYLSRAWRSINDKLFGGSIMVPPTFLVTTMEHHAADWDASKRLIRFAQSFITSHHWATVLEVLKHEMAHQYVSDVLGVEDETAHGPAFRMICERYGIDARASGVKRTEREEHAVDKIKKLLSLGASPNENEAKAALKKARQLLDENGLVEGDLRSSEPDEFGVVHLGEVVLRSKPEDYRLVVSTVLSGHFRVQNIWVHTLDGQGNPGLQLEICGRRCDLAIAEHVHDFLHAEGNRLWRRTRGTGKRERLDFLEGVMRGFLETLTAETRSGSAPSRAGLVHLAMAADLTDYFERRHPEQRRLRGSQRQRGARFGEGMSAGRRLRIHEPMSGSGPRLLSRGRESETQSSEED